MGWERKRGKLLDLNHLMRGGFDSFPVKVGDLSVLPRIRYVITLDSDTQLPRDAAKGWSGRSRIRCTALSSTHGPRWSSQVMAFFSRASASAFNRRPAAGLQYLLRANRVRYLYAGDF